MTGELRVHTESLDAAISTLSQATSAIATALSTLENRSGALRSQWTGEAAEAYTSAHSKWTGELAELNGILDGAVEALAASKADYADAEKANAERWRG